MNSGNVETFFRPPVCHRQQSAVSINLYHLCRKALRRSPTHCAFVPIRSMQFQAVIDDEEIIFVDSQGYMVHQGSGGRVILLAWRFPPPAELESLSEPVACTVFHYREGLEEVQRRLIGELTKALELLEERALDQLEPRVAKILSFVRE